MINVPRKGLFSLIIFFFFAEVEAQGLCNDQLARTKPDTVYYVNDDGTLTDLETDLTWMPCILTTLNQIQSDGCSSSPSQFNWPAALQLALDANNQGFLGHTDWRLPSIKELNSLVELGCSRVTNPDMFYSLAGSYWSSTAYLEVAERKAWALGSDTGIKPLLMSTPAYVILVR